MSPLQSFLAYLTHPRFLLASLLALLFLFGGSARPDSLGQLVVIPLTLVMLLVATWRYLGSFSTCRAPWIFLGAACAITVLQLIPLPPSIWASLPGHGQFDDLSRLTGTEDQWRPLNLVPQLGWITLAALLVPAAVLAFASGLLTADAQARESSRGRQAANAGPQASGMERLLVFLVLLGVVSAVLSVAQLLGPPHGPLYLHRITNEGAAVGFFANRNHNAAFLACLLPLIATWASMPSRSERNLTTRNAALVGAASLIIALVLIGGSRAGIVLAVIGAAWSFLIYRPVKVRQVRGEKVGLKRLKRAFAATLLIGMALLTIILSRAQSVDRAMEGGTSDLVLRTDFWLVTLRQAMDFFPFGAGLGSFVETYRMVEPLEQLTPYYVNHAHNDWLETFHGGGLAAAVLLAALSAWWLKRVISLFRSETRSSSQGRLALAGAALTSILGVASFVDYPLRTAPLAAVFMLGLVWLSCGAGGRGLASK